MVGLLILLVHAAIEQSKTEKNQITTGNTLFDAKNR